MRREGKRDMRKRKGSLKKELLQESYVCAHVRNY